MVLAKFRDRPNTTAAGLGGAVSLVGLYAITSLSGWDPPPEVAAAIIAIATTVSVEFGQFVRRNGKEQVAK